VQRGLGKARARWINEKKNGGKKDRQQPRCRQYWEGNKKPLMGGESLNERSQAQKKIKKRRSKKGNCVCPLKLEELDVHWSKTRGTGKVP